MSTRRSTGRLRRCSSGLLAIREKVLGPQHPDVASTLETLGWMYELQGKPAEAKPLLSKAVTLYELDLGAEHPHVARCLSKARACVS